LPDFEGWLRSQGKDELAEEWRYRHMGSPKPRPQGPGSDTPGAALHTRFAAAWDSRESARVEALNALRAKHARDVANLKVAAKQRWRVVGLVSHGRLAGALWALQARRANERAWRRLHEQHRAAVRSAHLAHPPLQWPDWLRSNAVPDQPRAHLSESELPAAKPDVQRPQNHAPELAAGVAPLGAGRRKGRSR
jgi:hypothetical protein